MGEMGRGPHDVAFARHCERVRARLAAAGVRGGGPETVSWKINREIVVVAGWGRAILLQFAHPLISVGVAEHSTFRGGFLAPIRRTASTVGAMLSLTFGDEDEAIAAAAGINTIHDRVSGRLTSVHGNFAAGTTYSAHDAELLQWVHATLLDSIPLTYEVLVGPLTPAERDRYCEEATIIEPLLDIPAGLLPRNAAELDAYMTRMLSGPAIAVTDTARTLARAVLYPPLSPLMWPALRPIRLLTIGLLPPAIRDAYGFRWSAREESALRRWVSGLRALRHGLPRWAREWPAARRPAVRRPGGQHEVPAAAAPRR